ncbi:MAG: YeeE/YedE family protein [Bdellovibrionales bacterium]|jgi:uncharacterized membrane protein YedE/YeeE|nr:YeeE/YedE family protein [Bdellovibrionales bacterium]
MKTGIIALVVGFVFALGLGISGMTQPQKVIGFLDVFGAWDPSLVFVMIGAIAVHFVTYRLIRRRSSPLLSPQWHVPTKREVTPALVIGSVLFGVGWGLGGFCPGPAIVSLAGVSEFASGLGSGFGLQARPVVFVVSMVAGMVLFGLVDKKLNVRK